MANNIGDFFWSRYIPVTFPSLILVKLLIFIFLSYEARSQDSLAINSSLDSSIYGDHTLSTVADSNDQLNYEITGGKQVGSNLFHSFLRFSVREDGSAFFNNLANISNIFSRVTGSNEISRIDGLIRANGNASIFLINPNGIFLGPNAELDIGGSFVGTTANEIIFEDGIIFSANNLQNDPLLTITLPISLQFRQRAEMIRNQSFGDFANGEANFKVKPGNTLALIGGEIIFSNRGSLVARGGNIELGSVGSNSSVKLSQIPSGWSFGYDDATEFLNIKLTELAYLSTSNLGEAPSSGNIKINGNEINIDRSVIISQKRGLSDGGSIEINASNLVDISGFLISTANLSDGNGGGIHINTNNLIIRGPTTITTQTSGNGSGGDIDIVARDSVEIKGNNVTTQVRADTTGAGNAGNILINTNQLVLIDGGQLTTSTNGKGNAGNIKVVNSEIVEIAGQRDSSGRFPSGLFLKNRQKGSRGHY